MYSLAGVIQTVVAVVILAVAVTLAHTGILETTTSAVGAVVLYLAISIVLPGRRTIARKSLAAGRCPKCRGTVRRYPDERIEYFCPACLDGYMSRGRRVPPDEER